MSDNVEIYISPTELWHHGIKGQKWGVRRYQNPDGTLTEEGKRRYSREVFNALKGLKSGNVSNVQSHVTDLSKRALSQGQIKKLQEASWKKKKIDDKWDELQEKAIEYANYADGVFDKDGYFDDDAWIKAANDYLDKHGNDKLVDDMDLAGKAYMAECEKVAKELLGEIGSNTNLEMKTGSKTVVLSVKDLVADTLSQMKYRKRGDEWVVY